MPKKVKKVLHLCIIITIIVAIIFAALILVLRYNEQGETNMPFDITKVTIISTTDAQDVEGGKDRWNKMVSQNNDIYIDIQKNEEYTKKSIIDKIIIKNITIDKKPKSGDITIYKPSNNNLSTFENKEEYQTSEIVVLGGQTTNIKSQQISNQGGRLAFRCANNNLGSYVSNQDEELKYDKLLEKIGMNNDDLRASISFDIEIDLMSGRVFETTMTVEIPANDIVAQGKTSTEMTDLHLVFKRTEN